MKKIKNWSNKTLFSLIIFIIPAFMFGLTLISISPDTNAFNWYLIFSVMILCSFVAASAIAILIARYLNKKNYTKRINDYHSEQEKIKTILLESIWLSRWTKNNEALIAVLSEKEAEKMVNDIISELYKNGYEITKK
jgi:hypothetical protein